MEIKQNIELEQAKEVERLVMDDQYRDSLNKAIKMVKEKAIKDPRQSSPR